MGAIFTILAAPFFLMRKLRGVRFLWWKAHGHINWVGRFASFFCDEVVTSTESGFPIALAKRRIVGQAIDTTRFALPQSDQERDQKHIIFVGRVASIKHIEVFITVARVLKDDGYTFSVIGPHDDTAYAETLMHSAEGLPVTFVGSKTQQELVSLYQQASILLNTSLTHSMDKTVLEAMLCGCLPITANHAFETLLSPFGLYADTQDAARYVEMIRMNTEVPTERRAQLREEVVKVHSLDTFVDRVFKL
jgi:glycosyltransferase involved in cell wall biosynthesis